MTSEIKVGFQRCQGDGNISIYDPCHGSLSSGYSLIPAKGGWFRIGKGTMTCVPSDPHKGNQSGLKGTIPRVGTGGAVRWKGSCCF